MEAATLAMHKNVQVKRQCYFRSNSSYYTKVGSKVIYLHIYIKIEIVHVVFSITTHKNKKIKA